MILLALVASIGWADARGFHCPDKAAECIDAALLPRMPAGVHAALQDAACTSLDRPGGPVCDTAIATAIMAICPIGPQWWRAPPCWNSIWLRALAPNLEHGLDVLVRANPRGR